MEKSGKRKRVLLTVADKLEVCRLAKQNVPKSLLMNQYNVVVAYNRQVFIKFLLFWVFTSSFTTFQPILRRLTKQKDTNIKTAKHIKLLVVLHTHVLVLEFRYI